MTNLEFYDIIDFELQELITELTKSGIVLQKKEEQKKSHALLSWILRFYGLTTNYADFITDGLDDNSCDIIFNRKTVGNEEVFYVLQSKWNKRSNVESTFDSKEIKQTINDFETILSGIKTESKNLKFNKKYKELLSHIERNGRVKFLFIGLCNDSKSSSENVETFNLRNEPKIHLEILDINRIKSQFIESKYKEIVIDNPLEFEYKPENIDIKIQLERFNGKSRDLISIKKEIDAFIFIVRPKVIFELFRKFGFQLFYKNVRNPLPKSNYNEEIAQTLIDKPQLFWFFNNGITGITQNPIDIGAQAKEINLNNLQIINGAQTVFTVYDCYKNANKIQKDRMDKEAQINFRLIISDNSDLNSFITKYTNSQNPLLPSDFCANDDIHDRLQKESYKYNLWYEKRRGEFRSKPESITVIDKETIAAIYLACHLEEPILANTKRDLHFISKLHDPEGLYEMIFNDQTRYDNMLAAFRLFKVNIISTYSKPGIDFPPDDRSLMPFLTLSKIVLEKCLKAQFKDEKFNLNNYILKNHEAPEFRESHLECRSFVTKQVFNKYFLDSDSVTSQSNFKDFYNNPDFFNSVKDWIKRMNLNFEIISTYNENTPTGSLPR